MFIIQQFLEDKVIAYSVLVVVHVPTDSSLKMTFLFLNSSEADGILLPYFNSDSSMVSFHSPFLHLTVGLAAVVDKSSLVAHAVAVDDHAAVQVQTVVAAVGEVLLHHATPKIIIINNIIKIIHTIS